MSLKGHSPSSNPHLPSFLKDTLLRDPQGCPPPQNSEGKAVGGRTEVWAQESPFLWRVRSREGTEAAESQKARGQASERSGVPSPQAAKDSGQEVEPGKAL